MSANGVSEKVITYSNTLKENVEVASKKYSAKVEVGELDVKSMIASITEVFQNMENDVINDHTLTEQEKLALLASTTAGIVLMPVCTEVFLDAIFNQINRIESWNWFRVIGNFICTMVAVVIVIAVAVYVCWPLLATVGLFGLGELIFMGTFYGGVAEFVLAVTSCIFCLSAITFASNKTLSAECTV